MIQNCPGKNKQKNSVKNGDSAAVSSQFFIVPH